MNNPECVLDGRCKFLRAVEEAFFLLDRDQNRLISPDDFITIAKSIGKSRERERERTKKLDFHSLSKYTSIGLCIFVGIDLDPNEISLLIQTALHEQTDDHMQETELTAEQYSALMLRHIGPGELNDELRQTFDALDRNHDGRITCEDFDKLRYENEFFDQLDDEQYELIRKELINLDYQNHGINFEQFVKLMMDQ